MAVIPELYGKVVEVKPASGYYSWEVVLAEAAWTRDLDGPQRVFVRGERPPLNPGQVVEALAFPIPPCPGNTWEAEGFKVVRAP